MIILFTLYYLVGLLLIKVENDYNSSRWWSPLQPMIFLIFWPIILLIRFLKNV